MARGRAASAREVGRELARADVVILGEQHDNRDHHSLQALVLRDLVAAGARPAVVFEQLDAEAQGRIDAALATAGPSARERADAVAGAADWAGSGWPPFDDYRAIFEEATASGLEIRAAGLPRRVFAPQAVGQVQGQGSLDLPYDEAQRRTLEEEVRESHCGMAPPRVVEMMLAVQARRDEALARAAARPGGAEAGRAQSGDGEPGGAERGGAEADGAEADGSELGGAERSTSEAARGQGSAGPAERGPRAVVICGFGHARRDFGVPFVLGSVAPGLGVSSVAFIEAKPGLDEAAAYAAPLHAAALPFDYVVFTPRVDDDDPCEKFRASLERMNER